MRRFVATVSCIAALSTAAFAQDDHRDLNPVQVGYAVVTPTDIGPFGIPGGLTVFETFGLRTEDPALQAGVLPATMTTRMIIFASTDAVLAHNVGIGITNPAGTPATVTLTLRRLDGSTIPSATLMIPPRQQVAKFVSELFPNVVEVRSDFKGTVALVSDIPVAVVGLRFLGTKFSTIPLVSLSSPVSLPELALGIGGPHAVLLPQFAADGRWASEIIVFNNNLTTLTVRIDLFKQDGSPLAATLNRQTSSSFKNLVIVPGGTIQLAPWNLQGNSDF